MQRTTLKYLVMLFAVGCTSSFEEAASRRALPECAGRSIQIERIGEYEWTADCGLVGSYGCTRMGEAEAECEYQPPCGGDEHAQDDDGRD